MGVMGRANQGLTGGGAAGHSEPFLEKDELIRERTPLAIVDIDYDPYGSGRFKHARWIVVVEAWDPKFPIPERAYPPDVDAEGPGIITITDSDLRQQQFSDKRDEKTGEPIGLRAQLADAKAQGVQWIGPVAMVSGTSQRGGNNFKTFADVKLTEEGDERGAGVIITDSRGFPELDGWKDPGADEAPRARAATTTPSQAPAPVQQSTRSTGQRERARSRTARQEPPPPPPDQPAAPAAAPKVPRSPRTPATAAAAQPAESAQPAPEPAATRTRARTAPPPTPDPAPPSRESGQYENQQRREAVRDPLGTGVGQVDASGKPVQVRQLSETVDEGEATCPFCQKVITSRLYPADAEGYARFYAESARAFGWPELTPAQKAAGGQVIMHPNCPVTQMTIMLPFVEFADE